MSSFKADKKYRHMGNRRKAHAASKQRKMKGRT